VDRRDLGGTPSANDGGKWSQTLRAAVVFVSFGPAEAETVDREKRHATPRRAESSTLRAAIYTRVSTEEQAKEGLSLSRQEEVCRKAAREAGASFVAVFRGEGYTGTNAKRPALQALLSRLPEFDALYCYRVDRLCRPRRDRLMVMDACLEAGVAFHSVTERLDLDTIMGRAMVQVMGVFAQVEVETIRERVRDTLNHRATGLRLPVSRPAYGHVYPGENRPLHVNQAEADYVREVFGRYDAGQGLAEIAGYLNAEGAPRRDGGKSWNHSQVRRVLTNPIYTGKQRWKGTLLEGDHEALVDDDLFCRCGTRVERLKLTRPKGRRHSIAEVFRCGVCGGPAQRTGRGKRERNYHFYRCLDRVFLPEDQRHVPTRATAPKVEAVLRAYVEYLTGGEVWREAVESFAKRWAEEDDRGTLRQWRERVRELDADLAANLQAFRAGAIPLTVLQAENEPLRAAREELERRLRGTPAGPDYGDMLRRLESISPSGLVAALRQQPADAQVDFLRAIFALIELHPAPSRLPIRHSVPDLPPAVLVLPKYYRPPRGPGINVPDLLTSF
jgi:site-specific DNA recombinase